MNQSINIFGDTGGLQHWPEVPLFWPLVLSLLAHLLLSVALWQRWDVNAEGAVTPQPETRRQNFQLLPRSSAGRNVATDSMKQPARQSSSKALAPSRPLINTTPSNAALPEMPADRPPAKRATPRFDLTLPRMPAPISPAEPSSRTSTVFDSKFAQTLSDARKRSGAFPTAAPDLQPADSFVGGQRRSFLQIGKLCFEEIDADPLDSFSQQQWYPRSCD